ncbi:hypothetical protein NHX12_003611 [Muraenolepis orangiensis]|uniref:Uncharacterized protein n=1 Tax=Muraenolepis orangiensis TaxID=630683 RepID=A0A9Q0DRE6_9TELE|nr:hypothetical protein NHX12_003611 [Muraenolepis orangiensis]
MCIINPRGELYDPYIVCCSSIPVSHWNAVHLYTTAPVGSQCCKRTWDQRPGIRDPGSETRDQRPGIREPGSETRDQRAGIRDPGSETGPGIREPGSETEALNSRALRRLTLSALSGADGAGIAFREPFLSHGPAAALQDSELCLRGPLILTLLSSG